MQSWRAVVALGSLQEELARRLAASRQRIVELREQLAEVQSRLEAEEDRLPRLVIPREPVEEILGGSALPAAESVPVSEDAGEGMEVVPEAGQRGWQEGEQLVEVVRRGWWW